MEVGPGAVQPRAHGFATAEPHPRQATQAQVLTEVGPGAVPPRAPRIRHGHAPSFQGSTRAGPHVRGKHGTGVEQRGES
jgi:hypothetical protein